MKKEESHKTTFVTGGANNGTAQPAAPAPFADKAAQRLGTDPSSSFRSSRYPVPQFEFRSPAAL